MFYFNFLKDKIKNFLIKTIFGSEFKALESIRADYENILAQYNMRVLENQQKQELINELLAKMKPDPNYKGYDTSIEDGCCINPIWQVSVKRKNDKTGLYDTIVGMPLIYWIHSHLKTYGFNPDNTMRDAKTKVVITMDTGKDVRFPFYIKGKELPKGERLDYIPAGAGVIEIAEGFQKTQKELDNE